VSDIKKKTDAAREGRPTILNTYNRKELLIGYELGLDFRIDRSFSEYAKEERK